MEYVVTFAGRRGRLSLEDGSTRESVAGDCRAAAIFFLNGPATRWDKVDIVLWLTGPYARATSHVPRGERAVGMGPDGEAQVDDESVDALITRVRAQTLADLEKAVLAGGALDFAMEAMDRAFVRRATDADGEIVWVPIDVPRMRLRDRIRSLLAADYLNDPGGYGALFVCHRCEAVVFDEAAKELGACANHRRVSGVVPRTASGESDDEGLGGDAMVGDTNG